MEEKYFNAEEQEAAKSSPCQTKNVSSNSFDINRISGSLAFCKEERLTRTVLIDKLFNEGKKLHSNYLTLIYLPTPLETIYPAQVLFTVSKRNFKRSVDRNKIKRRMREAYRKIKDSLYTPLVQSNKQFAMGFIYKAKNLGEYSIIEQEMIELLDKFVKTRLG
jgi:ribonuclease P protein component